MAFLLLHVSGTPAFAHDWLLSSATGPVFKMEKGAWVEAIDNEPIGVGVPVRTLRGARAELSSGTIQVTLEPGSAVRIDDGGGAATVITQFAGTIAVSIERRSVKAVVVRTPDLTVTVERGSAGFTSNVTTGEVSVAAGEVLVVDNATGAKAEVNVGATVSAKDLAATGAVMAAARQKGNGATNGSNPGGNGNGNPGGNGNGNPGGNGNSGGNGNGNQGGNGNGNGNKK